MPLYDVQCGDCDRIAERLLPFVDGGQYELHCDGCGAERTHKRLPSLFAKPLFDRPLNPVVMGGSYDTAGFGRAPKVPQLEGAAEHQKKVSAAFAQLPDNATQGEVNEAVRSVGPGPSGADYAAHFNRKDVKEVSKAVREVKKRNKAKRWRHGLLKQGENINMRTDKLPGDPDVAS